MTAPLQDNRAIGIVFENHSYNSLFLRRFTAAEAISRPFELLLDIESQAADLDTQAIVGHRAAVWLETAVGTRWWHGIVARLTDAGRGPEYHQYEAALVPWTWLLTRQSDCRIFQALNVPDIVATLFRTRGGGPFRLLLNEVFDPWEYCVQYRETDYNFFARLLEHEGISHHYEHQEDGHEIVLTDGRTERTLLTPPLVFRENPHPGLLERVSSWRQTQEVRAVAYAVTDYNFEQPRTQLLSRGDILREHGEARGELFDYPGDFRVGEAGQRFATARIEEVQAAQQVVRGESTCLRLAAGHLFELTEHPLETRNGKYLLTDVTIQADAGPFRSGSDGSGSSYHCHFTCIPADRVFRPARITPKPIVSGPQTAVVTGPADAEIHCDKYGRVKVQFPWDRLGKLDENSSCWIRVAQSMAGKRWGALLLPRIGHEVVVEFLEGDPDRPLITGQVYNAEMMPPLDLPANSTMSGLRSNSSPDGGGCNEIRMEDKAGGEQLFIHGQKNVDIRNGHDRFENIGNEHHITVATNALISTGANYNLTVGANLVAAASADVHLTSGSQTAIGVGSTLSVKAASNIHAATGGTLFVNASGDAFLNATSIVVTGSSNITLQVGGSHIVIEAGGIKIGTGGDVTVVGTNLNFSASAGVKMDSSTTKVSASGTIDLGAGGVGTFKGATVQVN